MPPPAWVVGTADATNENQAHEDEAELEMAALNSERSTLAFHAEGARSPPEYAHRRAITNAAALLGNRAPGADPLELVVGVSSEEHDRGMKRSKFCIISEGHAPWTPRITEAIARGCVPVLLSPLYEPPFANILDWSKFAVTDLRVPHDLPQLRAKLRSRDYATLHKNLLLIRPLFKYCVDHGVADGGGASDGGICAPGSGDALSMLVFEMAQRTGMCALHVISSWV